MDWVPCINCLFRSSGCNLSITCFTISANFGWNSICLMFDDHTFSSALSNRDQLFLSLIIRENENGSYLCSMDSLASLYRRRVVLFVWMLPQTKYKSEPFLQICHHFLSLRWISNKQSLFCGIKNVMHLFKRIKFFVDCRVWILPSSIHLLLIDLTGFCNLKLFVDSILHIISAISMFCSSLSTGLMTRSPNL